MARVGKRNVTPMIEFVGIVWLACSLLEHWQSLAAIALVALVLKGYRMI